MSESQTESPIMVAEERLDDKGNPVQLRQPFVRPAGSKPDPLPYPHSQNVRRLARQLRECGQMLQDSDDRPSDVVISLYMNTSVDLEKIVISLEAAEARAMRDGTVRRMDRPFVLPERAGTKTLEPSSGGGAGGTPPAPPISVVPSVTEVAPGTLVEWSADGEGETLTGVVERTAGGVLTVKKGDGKRVKVEAKNVKIKV